ncbi:MAG: D-glycero-beta-D-manno-heptose 1-phosphate adenylyltransferase [Flavobacteriales bacterium]|nr:D-glycero-beta-D-manno-heptose 1-phosphate adenylyltransferase [Flavobacteriales bacterium]
MINFPTQEQVLMRAEKWKQTGKIIVFTNGVFDILHAGHVAYLDSARRLGHKLIVGLNGDQSVEHLNKGRERPVNKILSRCAVLSALRMVDRVLVFHEDTPLEMIKRIKPDVLVKGGDYDADESNPSSKKYIVGSKEVKEYGGKVVVIPLLEGFSTTAIVERLRTS